MPEKINDFQKINNKIIGYLSQIVALKDEKKRFQEEQNELKNQVKTLSDENAKLKKK
ncbi:MAG: hypothetical protein JEZ09_08620 [Salinivirgaceae bacterium]|nr:hypothetical protein [Salinivirgaceae bacterium]